MRSFHFDVGNSSTGPLGLCARVKARTREEALEILRKHLVEELDATRPSGNGRVEYINVYVNGDNIRAGDIDEEEACQDG